MRRRIIQVILAIATLSIVSAEEGAKPMADSVTDIKHAGTNGRNSEGAFVKLKDGRIMFMYTRYTTTNWDDHAHADLVAITSSDGGRTWSDYRVVVPNRAQNVMSVSLLRLQDGRIAMAYLEKSFKDRSLTTKIPNDPGALDCRPYFCTSSDEGETWTEPVDICAVPPSYIVLCNDRLVQLESGRIIVPIANVRILAPRIADGKVSTVYAPRSETYFYLSDDGGATWREARQCCYPPLWLGSGYEHFQEPGVVDLGNNRVMAWFRTNVKTPYKAFSNDGGETWTQAVQATEFPSISSPLTMKRNPKTGELTAVWCDLDPRWGIQPTKESWSRTPLVIARSKDNGASWHGHRTIETAPDHGFCYIAMLFDDDALLLAYCCGGGKESGVLQDLRIRRIENAK